MTSLPSSNIYLMFAFTFFNILKLNIHFHTVHYRVILVLFYAINTYIYSYFKILFEYFELLNLHFKI